MAYGTSPTALLVNLAEELHFGRAAAREHMVQSALSQQLQLREPGVLLLNRTTHQVGTGVPERFRQLTGGRPNVGIGWAPLAPPGVTSEQLAPSRGSYRGGVGAA